MRNPTRLSLFCFFLALLQSVYAFPAIDTRPRSTVVERQSDGAFSGPITVQTVDTTQTAAGVVTTTCTITLTPIVVNGQNLVREEKDCVTTLASNSSADGSTSTSINTQQLTTSVAQTTAAANTASAQVTATTTIAVVTPVFPAPTTAAASATTTDTASGASGTADAANASQTTSFTLPGQKLQVLPIGLGVFAGISVIALIVVALVTYERTKYRKAFRARKLAESGASMGYGGTG